jgi:hypothetical protein
MTFADFGTLIFRYLVRDDRRPTLYTRDYGSCMASTSFTINRFDAAYYKDNMTVMFHLGGETTLQNETIMSKYHDRILRSE